MNRERQDTGTEAHQKTLEAGLRQLAKQHEWAAISDDDFLAARGRMLRALEELPAAPAARAPTTEALALAERVGEVWDASTPDQQAAFMPEWFDEMRIRRRRAIEMRAREPCFPIVAAAVGGSNAATVGTSGVEVTGATHIGVVGQDDWVRFWSAADQTA